MDALDNKKHLVSSVGCPSCSPFTLLTAQISEITKQQGGEVQVEQQKACSRRSETKTEGLPDNSQNCFANQIVGASNCHVESARGSSVYMQTYESGALNNR
jgi:hypothetical protein